MLTCPLWPCTPINPMIRMMLMRMPEMEAVKVMGQVLPLAPWQKC